MFLLKSSKYNNCPGRLVEHLPSFCLQEVTQINYKDQLSQPKELIDKEIHIHHHTDLYSAQINIEKENIGGDKNEIERYVGALLQT